MALFHQLGGNPFNTAVGQKIEQATDASLASENWALNMEICDIINDTDEGPKDAMKAIRKRLQQNAGKNYTVVMYTLTVLETCVKNCGKRFHLLVTQKDFVQELVKLIGPKNDPPTAVQEKVLSLIQSWADAFRSNPEMQGVVQIYNDLRQKGIEFPMTNLDAMAPIYTPERSIPPVSPTPVAPSPPLQQQQQMASHPEQPDRQAHVGQVRAAPRCVGGPINLIPEQLAKLRSELDVVQGNMRVFGEMLTEMKPGSEHVSDWELLQELQKTCQAMQSRIVELVDKVSNEEVTSELLRINDELNNLFLRYERYEKKRNAVSQGSHIALPAQNSTTDPEPLIDFGSTEEASTDDIHVQLAGMNVGGNSTSTGPAAHAKHPGTSADEFDMFAQSRTATYEKTKNSGSTYADNIAADQVGSLAALNQARTLGKEDDEEVLNQLKEQDLDEMEKWLQDQIPKSNSRMNQHTAQVDGDSKPNGNQEPQDSLSTTEFDRFLSERAAAAERLPTITTTTTSSSSTTTANRSRVDKDDTALFAL